MTELERLEQLSPVPVRFVLSLFDCCGEYCHGGIYKKHPHINIADNLQAHEKLAVLAHEIGHAMCRVKGCDCLKRPDRIIGEIHAFKWGLKWLLKNKKKKALGWELQIIRVLLKEEDAFYDEAAKQVMETKLWQGCVDYVEGSFVSLQIKKITCRMRGLWF